MKLFWSQGYEATSLRALLQAMGIQRSSFYASFGDKKSLFIECLRLFGQRTRALAALSADADREPEQVIWKFFKGTVLDVPEGRLQHGCLLVNSILELADTDEELCDLSAAQLALVQTLFEDALRQARQQGRWQVEMTPAQAALYLMTFNQGLRVQCRKRLPRDVIWATVEDALNLIGLPYPTERQVYA